MAGPFPCVAGPVYAVILAGGVGKRFWPASRPERPKQFLRLTGARSMLQATVDRVAPLVPSDRVLVVASSEHASLVSDQLPDLPPDNLLLEPVGRNTAPAVAWAAEELLSRDGDAVMVVLAADHHITNPDTFLEAVGRAVSAADDDRVLALYGLRPDGPKTQYGYIVPSPRPRDSAPPAVYDVARFHEKPPAETASEYLEAGCFWNSGMFTWRVDVLLSEMRKCAPHVADATSSALGCRGDDDAFTGAYEAIPSISIDHVLLEHSESLVVVDSGIERVDLGNWDTVGRLWESDEGGNVSEGEVFTLDSCDSVHVTDGPAIVTVGVDDLVVVVSGGAVLVCSRERAGDVGRLVDKIGDANPERCD